MGDYDEALRIQQKYALPVFDRPGDMGSRASTLGKIANLLYACGEREDALHIHREQLPVFERLGYMKMWALTQWEIAAILQMHGQLDEALQIYREELLPVLERAQWVEGVLECHVFIAINYLARGATEARQKALKLLNSTLQDAQRRKLPLAQKIPGIIQWAEKSPESGYPAFTSGNPNPNR